MLTQDQIERLNEFTFHKHARQRVLLYLLSDGYSIQDVIDIKVSTLKSLDLHSEYDLFREEMLESCDSGLAFKYPGGKEFKTQDVYRIIRQATSRVMDRPLKLVEFKEYVRKG